MDWFNTVGCQRFLSIVEKNLHDIASFCNKKKKTYAICVETKNVVDIINEEAEKGGKYVDYIKEHNVLVFEKNES